MAILKRTHSLQSGFFYNHSITQRTVDEGFDHRFFKPTPLSKWSFRSQHSLFFSTAFSRFQHFNPVPNIFFRAFSGPIREPLPQIKKAEEMIEQSSVYISQDNYKDALPLLESSLELIKKYDPQQNNQYTCNLYFNLAYTYHHLKKNNSVEETYEKAISKYNSLYGTNHRDTAVVLLSYAEYLVSMNKLEEAIHKSLKAVEILRNYHHQDCFIACALSNYAGYLCAAERYHEALDPCKEALDIFCHQLGKNNDYTRACFSHMYQILSKLDLQDDIKALETNWNSLDRIHTKGLSKEQLEQIAEQFLHTIRYAEAKANPYGPIKGPKLYQMQLMEFFDEWDKKGLNIYDPALAPIIEQEVKSIIIGKDTYKKWQNHLHKKREEVISSRKASFDEEAEYLQKINTMKSNREEQKIYTEEYQYTKPLMEKFGLKESEFYRINHEDLHEDDQADLAKLKLLHTTKDLELSWKERPASAEGESAKPRHKHQDYDYLDYKNDEE